MAVLIYDGDCSFCRRCAEFATRKLGGAADVLAFQDVDLAAFGLSEAEATRASWWVEKSGRRYEGHLGIAKALRESTGAWKMLGYALEWPIISLAARGVYALIARERHRFGCAGCVGRRGRQRGGPQVVRPEA